MIVNGSPCCSPLNAHDAGHIRQAGTHIQSRARAVRRPPGLCTTQSYAALLAPLRAFAEHGLLASLRARQAPDEPAALELDAARRQGARGGVRPVRLFRGTSRPGRQHCADALNTRRDGSGYLSSPGIPAQTLARKRVQGSGEREGGLRGGHALPVDMSLLLPGLAYFVCSFWPLWLWPCVLFAHPRARQSCRVPGNFPGPRKGSP